MSDSNNKTQPTEPVERYVLIVNPTMAQEFLFAFPSVDHARSARHKILEDSCLKKIEKLPSGAVIETLTLLGPGSSIVVMPESHLDVLRQEQEDQMRSMQEQPRIFVPGT